MKNLRYLINNKIVNLENIKLSTWLFDKNWKEIFEWDKIKFEDYWIFEIKFDWFWFKIFSEELYLSNPNKDNYLSNYKNFINKMEIPWN